MGLISHGRQEWSWKLKEKLNLEQFGMMASSGQPAGLVQASPILHAFDLSSGPTL